MRRIMWLALFAVAVVAFPLCASESKAQSSKLPQFARPDITLTPKSFNPNYGGFDVMMNAVPGVTFQVGITMRNRQPLPAVPILFRARPANGPFNSMLPITSISVQDIDLAEDIAGIDGQPFTVHGAAATFILPPDTPSAIFSVYLPYASMQLLNQADIKSVYILVQSSNSLGHLRMDMRKLNLKDIPPWTAAPPSNAPKMRPDMGPNAGLEISENLITQIALE